MPVLERLGVHAIRDTLVTYRDAMRAHQVEINRLNVYPVPDGDTGTNMARTLDAVVVEMESVEPELVPTCKAISHGSLMGARGNSGVILSQILRGLAGVLQTAGEATPAAVAAALKSAAAGAYLAVLKPIEGTILTVARESADAAETAATTGGTLLEVLSAARDAGKIALDNTPELLPVLKEAGVVDAGGAGFLLLLDAALHVVDGRPIPEPTMMNGDTVLTGQDFDAIAHRGDGDVSDLRYEVMYFMDLEDDHIDSFKSALGEIGDSIVVVGGDGLWNCHVHTDDIGAAIEAAIGNDGRPRQIRVSDLFDEVAEEHAIREGTLKSDRMVKAGPSAAGLPPVTTAIVAVCSGDGLAELFGQLGVQGVIAGGQTLNPSTAELLSAVEHVNADEVVILPNNKNIIPVAEQVNALTKKTVVVVPTCSMPEALAALVVYDPESSAEQNAKDMGAAADSVATGEITQAVRDTNSDAGPIMKGDWIGIVRGDGIVSIAGTSEGAAIALLDHLITDEREIVTIVTGADAVRKTTDALRNWLSDARPDVQVEVHRGGQPLYPYLFGVE